MIPPSTASGTMVDGFLATRPHPHLPTPVLYLSNCPPDLPDTAIIEALQDSPPVEVSFQLPVQPGERIKPDAYYAWMPKQGRIEFGDLAKAEKGLAVLSNHPPFLTRGINVSPYPPPQLLPPSASPGRYITPMKLVDVGTTTSATEEKSSLSHSPSPSEVFDAVRPWGSIRQLSVWSESATAGVADANRAPSTHVPSWGARVEFWYDDEAARFDVGFGQRACLIKGWQVLILPETMPLTALPKPFMDQAMYNPHHPHLPIHQLPPHPISALPTPTFTPTQGTPMLPPPGQQLPHGIGPGIPIQIPFPASPPLDYNPPWASHNPMAIRGVDQPDGIKVRLPPIPPITPNLSPFPPNLPVTPVSADVLHKRLRTSSSRTSISSKSSQRARTWSLTLDQTVDGSVRATGLISDDGTYLQHGPGQHIRPAPAFGPGSTSSSGLVDYSNVFVKNLDPDINSHFLAHLFHSTGRIISAKVMRDHNGRSRGYGFVSFHTPEEAVSTMSGIKVGSNEIAVTLHEPRLLRPEKLVGARGGDRPKVSSPPILTPKLPLAVVTPPPPAPISDKLRAQIHRSLHLLSQPISQVDEVLTALVASSPNGKIPLDNPTALHGQIATIIKARLASRSPLTPPPTHTHATPTPPLTHPTHTHTDTHTDVHARSHTEAPLANSPATTPVDTAPITPVDTAPTESQVRMIRDEIAKIDPQDTDALVPIFLEGLSKKVVQTCLNSRSVLAQRYGHAKRALSARRVGDENFKQVPDLATDENTVVEASSPTEKEGPAPQANSDIEDISSISLEGLFELNAETLVRHMTGPQGELLAGRLGLEVPSAKARSAVEEGIEKMSLKSAVERKTELAGILSKKIETTVKRSDKVKLIVEMINAEPEPALYRLTLWPKLLEGHLARYTKGLCRRRST